MNEPDEKSYLSTNEVVALVGVVFRGAGVVVDEPTDFGASKIEVAQAEEEK